MSMTEASYVGALSDPLSMVVCIMSVEAGAISLGAETKPIAGSVDAEVLTGTSGTVMVVASKATGAATNSTVTGSTVEF